MIPNCVRIFLSRISLTMFYLLRGLPCQHEQVMQLSVKRKMGDTCNP